MENPTEIENITKGQWTQSSNIIKEHTDQKKRMV